MLQVTNKPGIASKQYFMSAGEEFFTMYWKNMGASFLITYYHYLDANNRQKYLINYGIIVYDQWIHYVSSFPCQGVMSDQDWGTDPGFRPMLLYAPRPEQVRSR